MNRGRNSSDEEGLIKALDLNMEIIPRAKKGEFRRIF